jgi:pyruvate/oxaloacetate carboxyltransferase
MKVYGYEMRGVVVWDYSSRPKIRLLSWPLYLLLRGDRIVGYASTQAEAVRKFVEAVKR